METIEKTLNNLVEQQFPAFYRTDGPVFVAFLKEYYKWMEGQSLAADHRIETKGIVSVNAQSSTLRGKATNFELNFANGDYIAVSADSDPDNYNIYTIDEVVNNTIITLMGNTVPDFSSTNSVYYVVHNQKNPNYYARRLLENKDVDTAAEEFIVYFKEKYLKNIQFETQTNTRLLLKRALDLYRSKGTPRSIDLLFKIVFGVPASVYYPGQDVFRLSDGQWYKPRYIEVSLKETNVQMVNRQIEGLTSGATAFCEAVVRKTVKGRFIDVLYISAINGTFQTGEVISCPTSTLTRTQLPTMIGSLTTIEVDDTSTGTGYELGDIVNLYSVSGEGATARITEVANVTGLADITLNNGGWGYSANAEVYVSEKVLILDNVHVDNSFSYPFYNEYIQSAVSQPLTTLQLNQGNGFWSGTINVYTYHANNLLKGQGRLISYNGNSTVGNAFVAILSGNLDSTHLYTESNTIGANIIGYTASIRHANLFATTANLDFTVTGSQGTWAVNETVYQLTGNTISATGTLKLATFDVPGNGTLQIINSNGVFHTGNTIYGTESSANALLSHFKFQAGIKDIDVDFISSDGNYITWANGLANATVSVISDGQNANLEIANLSHTEVISFNTDTLEPYGDLLLNANAYGFPANPTGNGTNCPIIDLLTFANVTLGRISAISGVNPGSEYNLPPFIRVYEPYTANYYKQDTYQVTISGPSGSFAVGETVEQSATGATGIVVSSNTTSMLLRVSNYKKRLEVTSNSTTVLEGAISGVTANITAVNTQFGRVMGYNANIAASVAVDSGAIVSLELIDSGFGFREGEQMFIEGEANVELSAHLGTYGQGQGFYKQLGGVTSGPKKIFDGLYYQDYSYEVRSSITLNRYEEMLKQLLHISGTKYFGAFIYTTLANNELSAQNTRII